MTTSRVAGFGADLLRLVPGQRLRVVQGRAVLLRGLAVRRAEHTAQPVPVEHRLGRRVAGAHRGRALILAALRVRQSSHLPGGTVLGGWADRVVHHAQRGDQRAVGDVRGLDRPGGQRGHRHHHQQRPARSGHRVAHVRLAGPPEQVEADHADGDDAEDAEHLLVDGLRGLLHQRVRPAPHRPRIPGALPQRVRRADHRVGEHELAVGDHRGEAVVRMQHGGGAAAVDVVRVVAVPGVPVVAVEALRAGLLRRVGPGREPAGQARVRRGGHRRVAALDLVLADRLEAADAGAEVGLPLLGAAQLGPRLGDRRGGVRGCGRTDHRPGDRGPGEYAEREEERRDPCPRHVTPPGQPGRSAVSRRPGRPRRGWCPGAPAARRRTTRRPGPSARARRRRA